MTGIHAIDTCFFVSTSISLFAAMISMVILYLLCPFPEKQKKHYDIHYIGFIYELISGIFLFYQAYLTKETDTSIHNSTHKKTHISNFNSLPIIFYLFGAKLETSHSFFDLSISIK